MPRCLALNEDRTALTAQLLVCDRLVRACRGALYEVALDDAGEPEVRRLAVQSLKEILADWQEARRAIRHDLGRMRKDLHAVKAR